MEQLITLYRFELKKLMKKKMVWISLLLCIAFNLLSLYFPLLGDAYTNNTFMGSNYDMYQTDKAYQTALTGRAIDQALLEETIAAYHKIPEEAIDGHYVLTEEYQQYARPYSTIVNFIYQTTDIKSKEELLTQWQPSESDLYERRQAFLLSVMESYRLSDGEIAFWLKQEAQVSKPIVYEEHSGMEQLFGILYTVGFMVLMLVSVSLSGVFSEEHTRKTDQMILCTPLGKTKLYSAKIAAGISFALISSIIMFISAFVFTVWVYGAGGFDAVMQLMYPSSSAPLSCIQTVLIGYGCMIVIAVLISVFVMVLSELLRSSVAALAVSTSLIVLSMFVNIPEQYRAAAQIFDWLPWGFLGPWNIFGRYTLSLFGQYLTPWQAVPIIYLIVSVLLVLLGKKVYQRYQISGR